MKAVLILVLVISFSSVFGQVKNNDLRVTYIANEGFMLKTKHHKILVDALFSDGYGYFAYPSNETTKQILSGTAPFDSVNLCLLTHYHKDHSDSKLMQEYLSKYPSIKLVTTRPSLVFIDGEQFGFIKLKKQFCEITPETNKSISQIINNVPVKVLGLKHMSFFQEGYDLEEYMTNVGFYINLNGIRIFHSGDTKMDNFKDYVSANDSWKDPVDVAFVYYELLNDGKPALEYLVKILNPKYIVVMHVPPSLNEEWSVRIEQLKQVLPNIILFKSSLEIRDISIE